jgi:hypothetical protein
LSYNWKFAKSRAIGSSHIKTGIPCQDRLACEVVTSETLIAAVADGAGSASHAEIGADIVVQTVVRLISRDIESGRSDFVEILKNAAMVAQKKLYDVAQKHGAAVRDFATTLLAVIAGPQGGAALQIGDGVIVVHGGTDGWVWVFWPQRGEYANTTFFLTDENALNLLQVEQITSKITEIALMTDGIEPLVLNYASQTVHEPFFNGIFEPLLLENDHSEIRHISEMLNRFFSSERVRARTDDDISFIMATRRPQINKT